MAFSDHAPSVISSLGTGAAVAWFFSTQLGKIRTDFTAALDAMRKRTDERHEENRNAFEAIRPGPLQALLKGHSTTPRGSRRSSAGPPLLPV